MIWTSTQKKDTKIVFIKEQTIYLCNPKESEIDNYIANLKMNILPQKDYFSIPFHYIKTINFYENNNKIEFLFGSSTEDIYMSDPAKKEEIFNYLSTNIPGFNYHVDKHSGASKPIIAIMVCMVLFIWSYLLADGFEQGNLHDDAGRDYGKIESMLLILASLGTKKLTILFACIFAITGFSIYKKMKNPYIVRTLER